jgi:uncharacterized membrane protein YraQ (UPF0718 family)
MIEEKIKKSLVKTTRSFWQFFPVILGVLLLVGFSLAVIPENFYRKVFFGDPLLDSLAGAVLGSIAAGNPITSYVIGGELLEKGVSLVAVTAFLLAWVTVGVIQFPAESLMLGRRFALARNAAAFFSAILIAVLTVLTMSLV